MENASNALLMAAAVLIGIMILSTGVYLFVQFSSTSRQISNQLSDNKIAQFNSQFTKYEGSTEITAHDIVSVANLAKQNNQEYYGDSGRNSDAYYIQVKLENAGAYNTTNFESERNDEIFYQNFLKNNDLIGTTKVTFTCTSVEFSDTTKLVKRIVFKKNTP